MNVTPTSNTLNWNAPGANMYGSQPCPWCGGKCRVGYRHTQTMDCDDCGFVVPLDDAKNKEDTEAF